ncbi:Glutaredoxin-related protein [Actinobacillus ureae]|uniref:hypothetical protein n=1 Tax=Actinobacillus ureae TaxID=723 RepID=UPI000E1AD9B7|nr:hypothetical protein [Actinobacillus ureae]SUT87623.1 Glutaredoxin-related protein [Actinobacillus ureae]SUU49176.1 Glutaredoxin-related protein [Actinobacillus ureae]
MQKPILYFAHWCSDTAPFLGLRDRHPAFDNAKANGYIGIPALMLEDERVVLDLAELPLALTY